MALLFVADTTYEVAHVCSQSFDASLSRRLHVEANVGDRGELADVCRAFETGADESTERVSVAPLLAGPLDAEEHHVVREMHVFAPRTLGPRSCLPVGLAKQDPDQTLLEFNDDISDSRDLRVPPAEVVKVVPGQAVEVPGKGEGVGGPADVMGMRPSGP